MRFSKTAASRVSVWSALWLSLRSGLPLGLSGRHFGRGESTIPHDFLTALLSTMMEAHNARYLENASFVHRVTIPTLGVRTVDFHITPERREALHQSGRRAAEEFFRHWSPDTYI